MKPFIFSLLITFLCINTSLKAENSKVLFTDYKPSYQKWKHNYMIDQVDYTESTVIIHFRYISFFEIGRATFYGRNTNNYDRWYLKDLNQNQLRYELLELTNIRKNGELLLDRLDEGQVKTYASKKMDVFTCQVEIERPKSATVVDLIEGVGKRAHKNRFNCFKLKIKGAESTELGTPEDAKARITSFNKINNKPTEVAKAPKPASKPSEQQILGGVNAGIPTFGRIKAIRAANTRTV